MEKSKLNRLNFFRPIIKKELSQQLYTRVLFCED